MIKKLEEKFVELYGVKNEKLFFAPGRVNLIGEHTDYNGGHVFPCALDFGTYVLVKVREDKLVRAYSENFVDLGLIEFSLDDLKNEEKHDWVNYPKGVIKVFKDKGFDINKGFDMLFFGNIPNGAGLSSSASVELATSVMLKSIFSLDVDMIEMVKLSQKAENEFIGVNCGIMDQFAIGMGEKDRAILLDCNTLEYKYAPVVLQDASIVIINSNKRRGLAESKYNERRTECERGLSDLQKVLDIKSLGQLSELDFENNKNLIANEIDRKRVKHAVYENQRTLKAVRELQLGNIEAFGKLMNQSHVSLRDDYEVTGKELDTLVELAWLQEGVIGARMTGAGFGGCTVNIVKNSSVDKFIKEVGEKYEKTIGLKAEFYIGNIGHGAREL